MLLDLHATRQLLHAGQRQPQDEIKAAIAAALAPRCEHVFLQTTIDEARRVAGTAGIEKLPLAGLAVSIKDLFDVAGQTTRAGSVVLQDAPAATQDSPAVARLRKAGAAFIGRTNMVEFAYSGVGTNPHYGTPRNAAATDVARIPGGSTSGGAVSVASGAAFAALGSDTGGSLRIPAALNGIVGFKCTARLVPTAGALPLSTTLDSVGALTRSVRDAMLLHEVLSQRAVTRSTAPLQHYRLASVRTRMQDGLDATVTRAWQRSLATLRAAGAKIEEINLPELDDVAAFGVAGGFSAAESYAWHHDLLKHHAQSYDPRVLARIQRGSAISASDYLQLQRERQRWIERMEQALRGIDGVLSPTVPIVAPPIAQVAPGIERDAEFFRINALLLQNTSVINLLDGCALSLPCQREDELPVGLMLWSTALRDDTVLNIGYQVQQALRG